jgi:hypothetical protein
LASTRVMTPSKKIELQRASSSQNMEAMGPR